MTLNYRQIQIGFAQVEGLSHWLTELTPALVIWVFFYNYLNHLASNHEMIPFSMWKLLKADLRLVPSLILFHLGPRKSNAAMVNLRVVLVSPYDFENYVRIFTIKNWCINWFLDEFKRLQKNLILTHHWFTRSDLGSEHHQRPISYTLLLTSHISVNFFYSFTYSLV